MSTRHNAIGGLSLLPLFLIACSNATPLPAVNGLTIDGAVTRPISFTFQTLADPNFGGTYCEGINDQGVVAGFVRKPGIKGVSISSPYKPSNFHLYTSRTAFLGFRGEHDEYGFRVGDKDVVFGFAQRNGRRSAYREAGSADTEVTGIYGKTGVVGFYVNASGADTPYRIVNESIHEIAVPDSVSAAATGVNSHGHIVGWTESAMGIVSGWLLARGHFAVLQYPQSMFTQAFGINAQGDIVGMYTSHDGRTHGFIAVSPYASNDWHTIDDPHAGSGAPTAAIGINDNRAIVGWYMDKRGHTDGFLATLVR